jgi:sugar phosphate isomerase/epimerase
MKKKISIGSWAYCFGPYQNNPVPLDEVLGKVARLGFAGISVGGFRPHAYYEDYPTLADRQKLAKKIKDCGLEVLCYTANIYQANPLTELPEFMKYFDKTVQMMVDCGFQTVRIDSIIPPIVPSGMTYEACKTGIIEFLKRAAQASAKEGINVVWEFEPGFMLNKPSEVVEVYKRVNEKNFSLMFDTCHAQMCAVNGARHLGEKEILKGGILEFIGMVKDMIGIVHLIDSDNTLHGDETSTHAPFGQGVINFDEVIPALLNKANYKGDWWEIDLCFWADAWNVTEMCKKFVDGLNAKYCA